jgi:hypothetical protein
MLLEIWIALVVLGFYYDIVCIKIAALVMFMVGGFYARARVGLLD